MLAPPIALAWATAYTFRMSQRAMLEQTWLDMRGAKAAGEARVRELTQQWAVGLCERMHIEVVSHGVDRVDWTKTCVIMANHQSYLDVLALYRGLPRIFGFVAKRTLTLLPFFGGVMRAVGCVPINRTRRDEALESMREAARIVSSGSTITVFPEGTRGPGDRILPLKKGSFYLVQMAQVPTVPIGIRGAAALMPRANTGIRPGTIEVHVGDPIPPPPPEDPTARETMLARVRAELGRLADAPLRDD